LHLATDKRRVTVVLGLDGHFGDGAIDDIILLLQYQRGAPERAPFIFFVVVCPPHNFFPADLNQNPPIFGPAVFSFF
jgi:hypothetical protein